MTLSKKTHQSVRRSTSLELYPHQEIEFHAQRTHDLVISIGGVGSGKTTSFVLWLLDRMQWDTGQMHALFAHTTTQLRAVTRIIYKQLAKIPAVRHHERVFNCRPPKEWREDWERRDVAVPVTQDRYENVVIWPTGLHLQLGTLHNRSYEQYRGAEWGSVGIEEFTLQGVTREAFDFIDERVRCGDSEDGIDCTETYGHRHTKILHGNPPENPNHWAWELLDTLEQAASELPGATPREGNEGYPNLIAGIGPAILIPSRTTDNTRLAKSYIDNKLSKLDTETAARRLGGALTRTKAGRVYSAYSNLNETEMFDYDPNRTLYVSCDFNKHAAAATVHHPLRPGEYPSEHERRGVQHVGTFGTFFHVGGLNTEQMCHMLLTGERGNLSELPDSFKGLLEHRARITFYGDATANYEKMSGNDWEIVDRICGQALRGRYGRDVVSKRNQDVVGTIFAVNCKTCTGDGLRSYWVHPRNGMLRKDFLTNEWDKTGRDIQKYGYRPGSTSKDYQRTHAGDTVRYLIARLFPLGDERDTDNESPKIIRRRERSDPPSFL
jgi:hypothetical protein